MPIHFCLLRFAALAYATVFGGGVGGASAICGAGHCTREVAPFIVQKRVCYMLLVFIILAGSILCPPPAQGIAQRQHSTGHEWYDGGFI